MSAFNMTRDRRDHLLAAVIWVIASSLAHADQDGAQQTWDAFVAPIEAVFSEKLEHFLTFSERVFPQSIHDLRLDGEGHLIVQKEEGDPYLPAPERLLERVPESFRALSLLGVRSDDQVIELAPAAAFPEFNGITLFLSVVYAPELSFAGHHCGERTVIDGVEGGRCWWPLSERGWYIDVIWPEHGATSPSEVHGGSG